MRNRIRTQYASFRHAWKGIAEAVVHHQNFQVHILLGFIALLGAIYFEFTHIELIIVIFTIVLGLSAEMINTALESMTDLITKEWREEARFAKDVSAGMMLIVALGALVIAVILFAPHLISIVAK